MQKVRTPVKSNSSTKIVVPIVSCDSQEKFGFLIDLRENRQTIKKIFSRKEIFGIVAGRSNGELSLFRTEMAINVGEKVFQFDKTDTASKNTFSFKIGNRNSNCDYAFENAISDARKLDTSLITIQCCKDGTTQTEHMYMIRAARSCPCSMICQQKCSTIRGTCRARELFKMFEDGVLSHDFLYRKASDNLVYEKGKASQSPSYIPVLERFRWRYVQPKHGIQ